MEPTLWTPEIETRLSVLDGMLRGVREGWWPSFDPVRLDPRPWPWCFVIETGELRREVFRPRYGFALWETVTVVTGIKFLSQILPLVGVATSVTDARKMGFGTPITPGEFFFKKKTVHLFVETD